MPDATTPPPPSSNVPLWDETVVFPMITDPVRRSLLRSLALGGPRAASQLLGSSGRSLDATLKHLTALRGAGLVSQSPDPTDKRRQLYALAPAVPLKVTPAGGKEIDFGFSVLRL